MTNPTNNLAKNLTDAYDICDPVKPLQGDDLDKYYIPLLEARKTEAIVQVGPYRKALAKGISDYIFECGR